MERAEVLLAWTKERLAADGLASVQGGLGDLLAIGHRGVDMGIGSTALELAHRCKTSVLVAQPP